MDDLREQIVSYIKGNGFAESYATYDLLETRIRRLSEEHQLDLDDTAQIHEYLNSSVVRNFVEDRQPVISSVPNEVISKIKSYFIDHENSLSAFTPVMAYRASNAKADQHLYGVVARHSSGTYACWTSFNTALYSMNAGHYGLSKDDAIRVLKDNFFDITDCPEYPDKYGMENSRVEIGEDTGPELRGNIAMFRLRRGGR